MPRVKWGVSASDADDFDRDSQYKPYAGPIPPANVVYAWRIKVMWSVDGDRKKNPQWRVGLELVPRVGFNEGKYRGFFLIDYIPIASNTQFRWVPLLDALGISGREFESQTVRDTDGKVTKIGRWRNNGDTVVIAQLVEGTDQNGKPRMEIRGGTYAELPENVELSDEDDDDDDDDELPDDDEFGEDIVDEDYEEEEEEELPRRTKSARGGRRHGATSQVSRRRGNASQRKSAAARRRRRQELEDDGF